MVLTSLSFLSRKWVPQSPLFIPRTRYVLCICFTFTRSLFTVRQGPDCQGALFVSITLLYLREQSWRNSSQEECSCFNILFFYHHIALFQIAMACMRSESQFSIWPALYSLYRLTGQSMQDSFLVLCQWLLVSHPVHSFNSACRVEKVFCYRRAP